MFTPRSSLLKTLNLCSRNQLHAPRRYSQKLKNDDPKPTARTQGTVVRLFKKGRSLLDALRRSPVNDAKVANGPTAFNSQSKAAAQLTSSDVTAGSARGWRKYADRFKKSPASHVVSFAILHELTAIVPLPLVYFGLQAADPALPASFFSEATMAEAERRGKKILGLFGIGGFEEEKGEKKKDEGDMPKKVIHAAAAYCLVKAAMPLRVAGCFALTPWFARVAVVPVSRVVKRFAWR